VGSNLELPRGMKDFDDDELFKIDYVKQKFTETAKLFGYRFMEPSPIEFLSYTTHAHTHKPLTHHTHPYTLHSHHTLYTPTH